MTISAHAERRRFTAEEVLAMVRAGVLNEDEPVELLAGELIYMVPQGPSHVRLTVVVRDLLVEVYRVIGHVQDHSPIHAASDSLPEPDIAVVRGCARDCMDHLPRGSEIILVVEVAVTTEREARDKAAIYARAGIDTYWLLNVRKRYVDVHTEPSAAGYESICRIQEADALDCPETDSQLAIVDLLP